MSPPVGKLIDYSNRTHFIGQTPRVRSRPSARGPRVQRKNHLVEALGYLGIDQGRTSRVADPEDGPRAAAPNRVDDSRSNAITN